MYHSIPGNDKLKMNRYFNIIPVDEKDLEVYNDWFKITLENIASNKNEQSTIESRTFIEFEQYGKLVKRDMEWLYILSLCKLYLPKGYEEHVDKYRFPMVRKTDYNKMKSDGSDKQDFTRLPFEIIFDKPVLYKEDNNFRLIAEFPNYALDRHKNIISVLNNEAIAVNYSETIKIKNDYYPIVRLSTNDFSKRISKAIHRLVAIAWIPNDSWEFKTLINHKDTDKYNYAVNNLEWVTPSSNAKHAFEAGVRDDNISVKMYDSLEKTIKIYTSVTEAFASFGVRSKSGLDAIFNKNGFYIAADRYEIRRVGDNRDFLLKTNSVVEVRKLMMAEKENVAGYEIFNLETKESHSGIIARLAKIINCTVKIVPLSCTRKTIINGWIVRNINESNTPWKFDEYKEVENKARKIKLIKQSDSTTIILDSIRQVAKFLNVDKKTAGRYLNNNNKVLMGYKLILL